MLRSARTAFVIVALACATLTLAENAPPNPAQDLLNALNTKDRTVILAYVKEHFTAKVPPEERVDRLMGILDRGAPFKLIRPGPRLPDEDRFLIEDRTGQQIAMSIKREPDGLIRGVLLTPPENLEAKPPKDYRGWENLQKLADAIRADTDCPALGIALIRDGKPEVCVSGVRQIGGKIPVGADEPWSIGSIGKPICSTLLALLIEDGKLSWDARLGTLLPELAGQSAFANVTVEQVMRHRGGIPQFLGLTGPEVEQIAGDARTPVALREKFVRHALRQPALGKPGEQFKYSNAGYAILSLVAERAAGKPYEELVRQRIFLPLGMQHSYIGSTTWPAARPMGHVPGPAGLTPREMTGPLESMFAGAGGGLYLSLGDVAKFGEAHLKGLRGENGLLKSETVRHLHALDPKAKGEWYACGWGIEEIPGTPRFHGHNGSNGTFRSQLAIFPEANLVVVSMVNAGGETDPSPALQAVTAVAQRYAKQ
jgi:CubicO group peptidase (beta-lactamase class C family)